MSTSMTRQLTVKCQLSQLSKCPKLWGQSMSYRLLIIKWTNNNRGFSDDQAREGCFFFKHKTKIIGLDQLITRIWKLARFNQRFRIVRLICAILRLAAADVLNEKMSVFSVEQSLTVDRLESREQMFLSSSLDKKSFFLYLPSIS